MPLIRNKSWLYSCCWHPSVSETMECAPWVCQSVVDRHLLLWLKRPILDRQILWQLMQVYFSGVSSGAEAELFTMRSLFRLHYSSLIGSLCLMPVFRACLQLIRSAATDSWLSGSMEQAFMSRFRTSLYRRAGLPKSSSLGIRVMCISHAFDMPTHLCLLWLSSPYMLVNCARVRTSLLVTWSCQVMPRILLRQRMWKCSCIFLVYSSVSKLPFLRGVYSRYMPGKL